MCVIDISIMFAKDNNNKAVGYAVVVLLYLLSPAYNFGFKRNMGLHIPEILPYHLQTRGLASFYFVRFCFVILPTFAVPIGLDTIQWLLWVMVEFVVAYLLFPETKGPSLEGSALIFGGPKGKDVEGI